MKTIKGTTDDDSLTAKGSGSHIIGYAGDDTIMGRGGNDVLEGGDGNDKITGGNGDDKINCGNDYTVDPEDYGTTYLHDYGYGGGGNDIIHGNDGIDWLYGENGSDKLFGDAGDDFLFGGTGVDTINGGDGEDIIEGGSGKDVLMGAAGNDRLILMAGNDEANGGAGNDTYILQRDKPRITDLKGGDIYEIADGDANAWIFDKDGADRIVYDDFELREMMVQRDANDLLIKIDGNTGIVTISDFFMKKVHHIEKLQVSDGEDGLDSYALSETKNIAIGEWIDAKDIW
ncbi:calcium-binding protein [Rhizobium alvei]|uniref:Calcium-binding protein n=1 Tax=Rhizobium alvei TaxID=1132659 RepID=A0ABT8YUE5_9HYPH|nr:calcium-binding protein [Rhizobium alvei]MDO6967095.1 calcium-binding protein [Rhizobium alvei]